MQRLTALFLALLVLAPACSPERKLQRQLRRYADELQSASPIRPDTTGRYAPGTELDVLDGLLRKYPGKVTERTILKTETVTLPGKVVYTTIPVRPDTTRNRLERDSLLAELVRLSRSEKADSEIKAEVARLKSNLLHALNQRGCLPDTTVHFKAYGLTLQVKRLTDKQYQFQLVADPQSVKVNTVVKEENHARVVYRERSFWSFWQSYVILVLLIGAVVLIVRLLVRPHRFYFQSPTA